MNSEQGLFHCLCDAIFEPLSATVLLVINGNPSRKLFYFTKINPTQIPKDESGT